MVKEFKDKQLVKRCPKGYVETDYGRLLWSAEVNDDMEDTEDTESSIESIKVECMVDKYSSRVCECGTLSCVTYHSEVQVEGDQPVMLAIFDDGSQVILDSWTGGSHPKGSFGALELRFVAPDGTSTVRAYDALTAAQDAKVDKGTLPVTQVSNLPKENIQDSAILDWIEHNHTLHNTVEFLYVVDGYQVQLMRDDCAVSEPFHGETLRAAIIGAMISTENINDAQ